MPAEVLAGAGHENDSGLVGRSEDVGHINIGLSLGFDAGDVVDLAVENDIGVGFEVFEVFKDSIGMAEKEGFAGVLGVSAGDYLWNIDGGAVFGDIANGGGQVDAGDKKPLWSASVGLGGL